VRCGTNFLLTVMVVTILLYSVFGRPGWVVLIASRVVLIPWWPACPTRSSASPPGTCTGGGWPTGMKPGLALSG